VSSPKVSNPFGYFENWKTFEPKKLSPNSIEDCSAEIAVITLMIEKIPIVIPDAVRADRTLFVPSDLQAILIISSGSMD
jgi:hypothetical protein